MTKLSVKKLSVNQISDLENRLWSSITLLENMSEVKLFFKDLLTRTEIQMISKRLEAISLLMKGLTFDQISKRLNIGQNTLSRLNERFENYGGGYRIVLSRMSSKSKRQVKHDKYSRAKEFWKESAQFVKTKYNRRRR